MDAGGFATIQELAEAVGLAERHVSRQLRLAYLAPEVLKRLTCGREALAVRLYDLCFLAGADWAKQVKVALGDRVEVSEQLRENCRDPLKNNLLARLEVAKRRTIGHQRNVETTGSPGNGSSSDTAHVQHVNRRSTSGSMKSVQSVMPQTLRNPPLPVLCRDRKPHTFPVVHFGSMGIEVVSNRDWIGTNKAISNLGERNAC